MTDDRDYLTEAFEYARGERRSLPSIEHVTAAIAALDEMSRAVITLKAALDEQRQAVDVRDQLLHELTTGRIVPPMAEGSEARN